MTKYEKRFGDVRGATLARIREIIEAGGAVFVKVSNNSVYFLDALDRKTISLYSSALRCADDVRMALKSHRERVADFHPWEVTARIK